MVDVLHKRWRFVSAVAQPRSVQPKANSLCGCQAPILIWIMPFRIRTGSSVAPINTAPQSGIAGRKLAGRIGSDQ
jgi:hypothetical protein